MEETEREISERYSNRNNGNSSEEQRNYTEKTGTKSNG
jgi:hypothetical protein